MNGKMRIITLILFVSFTLIRSPVFAQWPEKPVKIIIPWNPGAGAVDATTRALQKAVTDNNLISQPLTVLNVGGHFSIGLRKAKDSKPDGYNFVVMHMALMTGQASGMLDFGYKDFEPVSQLGSVCEFTVVRKDLGVKDFDDLMSKAAEKPNSLIHGANLGAINHVYGIMTQDLKEGAKFRFVQTGGDAKTYPALAGNHVDVGAFSASAAVTYTRTPAGEMDPESPIQLLAYAGNERHASIPEVPTFKELGYDFSFCFGMWYFAPKGTPQEAIDGFAEMVAKALETESMQTFLAKNAMEQDYLNSSGLGEELDDLWTRVEPVAKRAKKK